MSRPYQICARCVSDTSFPAIRFDEDGLCQYCRAHDALERLYPLGPEGQRRLERIAEGIRRAARGRKYGCVAGVSGGRDSTFCLYTAAKLRLRPLAVHFDNGWDSEIAVRNIKNACSRLNVDLHTHVADWEEFKDLQMAFLKASVPEAEVPTDVAIHAVLHQVAAEEGIRYVIMGHSFRTEGIAPIEWTYMDGRYIRAIRKRFGSFKQKTVPNMTLARFLHYTVIKRIRVVPILNYLTYRHKEVGRTLQRELGWTYYGGHHHESSYTHFVQAALFARKFNIDKRRLEYSALIRSGQKSRQEALKELKETPYPVDGELVEYCVNKLGLSMEQWREIIALPPRSFRDYPTYYPLIRALRAPIRAACRLRLVSPILYFKYLG